MSLMDLKSGTDIRGTAVGEENRFTDDAVKSMIYGFVTVLSEKTGVKPEDMTVSVGHDSRISSPRIKKAVTEQLLVCGVNVLDCSLCSTPAMFMTTVKKGCTGAVQITASHHPYDKNGLKFFSGEGGFEGSDITEILTAADSFDAAPYCKRGVCTSVDYMSEYAHDLRVMIREGVKAEDFRHPLKGFHIIVDAGNGVGGFYANHILKPLGADITGSQFLEPDGMFPNHIPNPENSEAMDSISKAVISSGADLGLIFDTDVDRAACVDSHGKEINRNRLVALASVIALENNAGGTVVTDSVTSDGLKEFINGTLGGVHHRFKRGYKNVINEAIRLNNEGINSPLAIETSGHAALRENYFLDDGAYLMTKIIIKAAEMRKQGKELADLIKDLKEPAEAKEIRFPITEPDFRAYGNKVIDSFEKFAAEREYITIADDNREGMRISFDREHGDGWALLRLSVHDPIMPLNIESNTIGGTNLIINDILPFFKTFDKLNIPDIK